MEGNPLVLGPHLNQAANQPVLDAIAEIKQQCLNIAKVVSFSVKNIGVGIYNKERYEYMGGVFQSPYVTCDTYPEDWDGMPQAPQGLNPNPIGARCPNFPQDAGQIFELGKERIRELAKFFATDFGCGVALWHSEADGGLPVADMRKNFLVWATSCPY